VDGIVIILLAVSLYFIYFPKKEKAERKVKQVVKNPMLNPEMIHDEHAFMEIAYELGFR
jgi:hypothetical protein